MGGLEISPRAEVLRAGATAGEAAGTDPIPGLFAAGEVRPASCRAFWPASLSLRDAWGMRSQVAGGIHGRNRLGGNSLLDCVVFGRVAGDAAAHYLFDRSKQLAEQHGVVRARRIARCLLRPAGPRRLDV
jgi:succinate dehydrogenase/fumarate reductase flavoprotein subunit